jgi:selenocysteine-specific translation elongation factor SelB
MTIDLGFAPMKLSDGELVGIIDVPGHEKFIRNMVAGASGIDIVILVVAADDSVMPQTREHLDIMTLLGVRRGIIAINKIDLVDEDMLELVEEEVRETVSGTFLESAPLVSVSAETGEGIDELRNSVQALVRELPPRDDGGSFGYRSSGCSLQKGMARWSPVYPPVDRSNWMIGSSCYLPV